MTAEPSLKPKFDATAKNAHAIGRYGTPEEALAMFWFPKVQQGARDAFKDGELANFTSLVYGVDAEKLLHDPTLEDRVSTTGSRLYDMMGDLNADQIRLALGGIRSAEKAHEILDNALVYGVKYAADPDPAKIAALVEAGANVNQKQGLPLRIASMRGASRLVHALYGAGASLDIALDGAKHAFTYTGPAVEQRLLAWAPKSGVAAQSPKAFQR